MKRLTYTILPVVVLGLLFMTGCFEEDLDLWEGVSVEFKPLSASTSDGGGTFEGTGAQSVDVQLIAAHQDQDVQVEFGLGEGNTAVEGTHFEYGSEAADGSVTIPAGNSSTALGLTVLFADIDPGDSETLELELTSASNGAKVEPNLNTFTLTINGLSAVIETSPGAIDFEEVGIGESETVEITLENSGARPSDIEDLALTGEDADAFSFEVLEFDCDWTNEDADATVCPGAEIQIAVTFNPSATGEYEASLGFTWTNKDIENTDAVSLSGTGVVIEE